MADTKRQVFYSFHYKPDSWRASQVRNIGTIEGNKPAPDNDWETVTNGGEVAIKKWIKGQMEYRSCTVILVGKETVNRKWINHEIVESWKAGMGVVAIHIYGLKNHEGYITTQGNNPFDYISYGTGGKKLSSIAKCYNPTGTNSKERYDWIARNMSAMVEEAIKIRNNN
ncbi:MAG: TIR domain-containing protein [Minisyncoccota bacterium]